ncbi:MAG TPA: hypothetical protein VKN14_03010 [Flavobacteriaceae bacterium]|nr:hypothetical protein [Flavobacteriaceae bacterium]
MANKKEYFENALHYKTPILTFDYTLKNDTLEYYYWNKNGINKKTLPFERKKIDTTMAYIKNKQIFYKGKPLTFDNSNKLKPIVVDKSIFFLSDNNRGVGFYNLCKLPIQNEHSIK